MTTTLLDIKQQVKSEFPNWTEDEVIRLAEEIFETQCVLYADLKIALTGKDVTAANIKTATVASLMSLWPPQPPAIVELDPNDKNRINVHFPVRRK